MASRIRAYDATVSLSRLTTVLTTPSLKPTLNLPSWFPPAARNKDRDVVLTRAGEKKKHPNATHLGCPDTNAHCWMPSQQH